MNNTKPVWIIFDVGGVILDWFHSSKTFTDSIGVPHSEILEKFHEPYKNSTLDEQMHRGAITPQEAWDIVLKPYDKSVDIENIIAAWCEKPYWIKPTLDFMDALENAGYSVCILTNSWFSFNNPRRAHLFPSQFHHYKHIFDSGELKSMKPDAPLYKLVEDTLKASPKELFFIDDNHTFIDAAKGRGWQTYYFESRKGKATIIRNITELQNILLHGPKEIKDV